MSNTEVITKRAPTDPEHLHDSEEYESAEEIDGEVYDDEEIEEVEVEIEEEDVEEEEEEEDEDGQTPVPKERELDDDEDRKNPQFIPKKGYFYEHDDRTKVDDGEEEEEEEEKVEEKPKKVVVKEADRWSHDKYEEVEQAPKSHDELSAAYGYDIRSEDQPPRARRRRRYGRGPNKYTRKWEEEEAYQKPRGGYRGRGGPGGGRGEGGRGFRNSYNNRRGSRGGYEEDFPELVDGPERKSAERERGDISRGRGGSSNRRDRDENSPNQPPARNRGAWNNDRDRNDREDRDHDSGRGGGGNGGRGRGGNRGGRGRRNEFTNRNRYPDRRDSFNNNNNHTPPNSSGSSNKQNSSYNGPSTDLKEREKEKQEKHWSGHDDRRERATVNGSTNVDKQKSDFPGLGSNSRQQSLQKKANLPFTNTEYTGSASLTAGNRNSGSQSGSTNNIRIAPPEFENISVKVGEAGVKEVRYSTGAREQSNEYRDSRENVSRENMKDNIRDGRDVQGHVREIQDAREIIKERQAMREREQAMMERERHKENNRDNRDSREREMRDNRDNRDVNRRPPNKGYQNDRRSQMPPRLQQQQQQQQQQLEQANLAAKTKRFSAQRQRQVESTMVSGGVVPPNSVVSPQLGQGVANLQPVVTGSGPMITSPVPVYPQAPTYYETAPSGFDAQVYEASASPVTGNGHNHGPSVSPSLWGPHASAYATAPYPSPPTGQVPVPQPPYADPAAFIAAAQQTGQPIYAPPQFIQDPTIINYAAAQGAPFAAPYHPQGFQGYAQVTPAPPPEMYHGGVTYYNTQNQIQRPPMIAPLKRPKTVLQLVEPPEKAKESHQKQKELSVGEHYSIQNSGMTEYYEIQEPMTQQSGHIPEDLNNYEPELPLQSPENITTTLQPVAPVEYKKQRSPSPRQFEIPEKDSWSAQMAELQSPTDTGAPACFSNESYQEVDIPKEVENTTTSNKDIITEKEQESNSIASEPLVSTPVPVAESATPQQKEEISKDDTKDVQKVSEGSPEISTVEKESSVKEEITNSNTEVSEGKVLPDNSKSEQLQADVKHVVEETQSEKKPEEKSVSPIPVVVDGTSKEGEVEKEKECPPSQPVEVEVQQSSKSEEIKDA